jgi:hypothetical protein
VPEGYAGAIGEAALLGSPFAEATFVVPPDPGVVLELSKPESSRERKAREKVEREAEAERKAAEKHAAAKARGIARRARKKSKKRRDSSSGSSSSESESSGSSDSDSSSADARPPKKRKAEAAHARPVGTDETLLKSVTPPGCDRLQAAAALFESVVLREAARLEELPPKAGWTPERVPSLRRRCALGITALDRALGGERWRQARPSSIAAVYVLAEEAAAALRARPPAGQGSTGVASQRYRRRRSRSRSPSSSSSSGKRSNRKKVKSGSAAGGSALLAPDTAEALNKAREFVEQAHAGATPGRGRAAGAVAALPEGLKSLMRKALVADKVEEGELRSSRSSLPVVVGRMRKGLTADIREALELCMSGDMSNDSELPRASADKLAGFIRRMDLSMDRAIDAVTEARGSRAPQKGSMLELQDAWALIRAGLDELERTVPVVGRAAEQIAAQLSTGAAAQGVSAKECKEWLKKVFTSLHTKAQDARLDAALPLPTLGEAVEARAKWLRDAVTVVGLKAAVSGGGGREGSKGKDREPKGKGKGKGGDPPPPGRGGGSPAGATTRLWADKPYVADDKFAGMRDKFRTQFPGYCWAAVMFGCKRDDCEEQHKIPGGFYKLVKECGLSKGK